MTFDTLQILGGTERSLSAWGFSLDSCLQKRGNSKADTWTGTIPQAGIASDPLFPYFASVILRTGRASATGADGTFSGGLIKFQGRRVKNPMKASGHSQGVTYEFQGPWHDLDITQYLQSFKGATTNFEPGEVVLNTAAFPQISTAGLRFISMGDQIQSILQFVLDGYAAQGLPAPFQYVGRTLLNGAINLDCTSNAGAPNKNTHAQANIYNLALPTAPITNAAVPGASTTIDPALYANFLKTEIIRPMSAAQCLQKLMDSTPRTNIAFDYSTTPPTCWVYNVDNLPATSLALFDGISHKSIDIQRRDDLIPSAVIIGYRVLNSVNGQQEIDFQTDKWGPHGANSSLDPDTGPGVIVQTLDLQGTSETFATGQLDCEPLACIGGTQATKRAWWSSSRGGETQKLADFRVRFQDALGNATTIPDARIYYASTGVDSTGAPVAANQEFTTADYAFFTDRIVRGTYHSWMALPGNGNTSIPVKAVKVKIIAAAVTHAEYNATSTAQSPDTDKTGQKNKQKNLTDLTVASAELTNGVTGFYTELASVVSSGEIAILGNGGIAQYLFTMLSVLQYEGEFVKVQAAFDNPGTVSLLNRLNLTGGRAEWQTMNAQIQQIEENWGRKETRVRVGVSKHLSADQLNALLNMWRFRRAWYNPQVRSDNTDVNGQVEMPVTAGSANSVEGLDDNNSQTLTSYATPPANGQPGVINGKIALDPTILTAHDTLNTQETT